MKSRMNEMESSPYCTSLGDTARQMYKQKITIYVEHDSSVMKRSICLTERLSFYRDSRYKQLVGSPVFCVTVNPDLKFKCCCL